MRTISLPLNFKTQLAKLGRKKKTHLKIIFGVAHKTNAKLLSK